MQFLMFLGAVVGSSVVLTLMLGGGIKLLHNYQVRERNTETTPKVPTGTVAT